MAQPNICLKYFFLYINKVQVLYKMNFNNFIYFSMDKFVLLDKSTSFCSLSRTTCKAKSTGIDVKRDMRSNYKMISSSWIIRFSIFWKNSTLFFAVYWFPCKTNEINQTGNCTTIYAVLTRSLPPFMDYQRYTDRLCHYDRLPAVLAYQPITSYMYCTDIICITGKPIHSEEQC